MKTKSRIKIPLLTITTRDEAESVMSDIACIVNNQRRIAAQRDAEVLAINERYEPSLTKCGEDLKYKTDALRAWAEANPEQFPKDRKSIQFISGLLGFRTGTPKLALLDRSWNWEKVLSKLEAALPDWVRTKKEVDKEAVLGAVSAGKYRSDTIAPYGMKIVQDETFFVSPNLSDIDLRQTAVAA